MGFEIAEQLGWRLPRHTVVPMASGSLLTKISKAYTEFQKLGLVDASRAVYRSTAPRPPAAPPSPAAFKRGTDIVKPVQKPDTIAKSLAIGTPADGYYAIHAMRETGGARGRLHRRGDRRGHPAAGRVRGDLCRDGGRRHGGLRQEADRNGENPGG